MADLPALREFAATHFGGLTAPLSNDQVVTLAEYWQPEARFHPDERFHPISLSERVSMVGEAFRATPADERDQWLLALDAVTADGFASLRVEPPIVYRQVGQFVQLIGGAETAPQALEDAEADSETFFSHGATSARSRKFFGAENTEAGSPRGTPGDPLIPKAKSNGNPHITVLATYKNVLDVLKYELLIEAAPEYPPDGMRLGSELAQLLLSDDSEADGPTDAERRDFLLALISAHESGDEAPAAPNGVKLQGKIWDAVTRYAFLEYDYFYAYNDWERFQVAIWDNEHEGDDEGCCLVFDRNVINAVAGGSDDRLRRAVPEAIITCVHEELHDSDEFQRFTTPIAPADDSTWSPRDDMEVVVYVAGGSHATYLTGGTHDVVDFQDMWDTVQDAGTILLALALSQYIVLAAIWEHFQDTEDFTSDEGVRAGPDDVTDGHSLAVDGELVVLPMSKDEHLYESRHADLLRLRAFAGKWGGDDGIIDKSPAFSVKTARYFRRLVQNML